MSTRLYRSFATELIKIAVELQDPDVRKLMAERKGEEYLVGGEMSANETTSYFPSYGAGGPLVKGANLALGTGMMNFKANKKDDTAYQHVRDWGWRGAQGAAAGAGLTQLTKNMKGHPMNPKDYRRGAAIGASAALGDRLWRHRKETIEKLKPKKRAKEKTAALVQPNPMSDTPTPATALSAARQTGGFKSQVLHKTGKPPKIVQLGKKFRLPPGVR